MSNQILNYPETFGYRTYPAKNEVVTEIPQGAGSDKQIPTTSAVIKAINAAGHVDEHQLTENGALINGASAGDTYIPYVYAVKDYITNYVTATTLDNSDPNYDADKLPDSGLVLGYAVSKSDIETDETASGSDTKVASTNYVIDYIASLGFEQAVTSTVNKTVAPLTAQTYTAIDGALGKACDIVVTPNINNIGAVYISESNTYSGINPIYPDPTNNYYKFANAQNVYIFVDNVGDSVDLTISYRG